VVIKQQEKNIQIISHSGVTRKPRGLWYHLKLAIISFPPFTFIHYIYCLLTQLVINHLITMSSIFITFQKLFADM